MTISFIVPTIGRASLEQTLASIETWPGDEILIVADTATNTHMQPFVTERGCRCIHCLPGGDWGHTERNMGTPHARGQYIAHIDDDDTYAPGTRALMADAIQKTPGVPILFKMKYPCGIVLWQDNGPSGLRCGNVGTPMILIPNEPERFGVWRSFVGGDFVFLDECKWKKEEFVWRPEIIALLGHNT